MEWNIVVGVVCTVLGAGIAYAGLTRSKSKDDAAEGKQAGTMLTEIGYIKSGVDDIKRKQDKQDERHVEIITRLTACESSTKQAHHRIDRIEGREEH
ncbi:MAG: hypothetical protein VB078_06870 [Clostridiaceae bacterium]|nr:hypothetical protein [Clostridiaceae bacterium]